MEENPLQWKEDRPPSNRKPPPSILRRGQELDLKSDAGPILMGTIESERSEAEEESEYVTSLKEGDSEEEELEPEDLVQFRIFCPDLERWFLMKCWDPLITIAEVKKKMFHATGVHPFYARFWFKGNPLRNDTECRELPFQPFVAEGDPGLVMTVCIAVDDDDDGMEIKLEEDTPEMKLRENKPPVYPRAKSLLLTDWATSTARAKVILAKQKMLDAQRQMQAQKAALEEVRFRASQCLVQGSIELNTQVKARAEKREEEQAEIEEKNKRVRLFLKDLVRYLALLFFFQIALYIGPNGDTTRFDVLGTFRDAYKTGSSQVLNIEQFWEYQMGQFLDLTVPSSTAAGRPYTVDELGWTLGMNYLVGDLQLTQYRSQIDQCFIEVEFLNSINHCYLPYRGATSASGGFGPSHQYRLLKDIGGMKRAISGKLKIEYPVEGYTVVLPKNAAAARILLADMKTNRWIDEQTRSVVANFLVYNPSIDNYISTAIIYEFPPWGGVLVEQVFTSLLPIRYDASTAVVLMFEIIVMMQVIWNVYEEARLVYYQMDKDVMMYLEFMRDEDPFRFLDWGNYIVCTVVFCIRMRNVVETQKLYYDPGNAEMVGYYSLVTWYNVDIVLQALNCIQMWIKSFKFVSIFHTPSILQEVYTRALPDLLQFTVMFVTINIIFAQAGMMFFGPKSEKFVTIMDCLYSLFDVLTGKMTAFDLEEISPYWGSIFYILYMVFQVFLFLNYVFGVFSFALKLAVYSARPEKYFGFFIRNFLQAEWDELVERLSWVKFWERKRKKKSEAALYKANQNRRLNLKPEDMYVSDAEILCARHARNHYMLCFGEEEADQVVRETDSYGVGRLDKKQACKYIEKTCARVELTDMGNVSETKLVNWDLIVDPLVFDVIEEHQVASRNTLFAPEFFGNLRKKMKPDVAE